MYFFIKVISYGKSIIKINSYNLLTLLLRYKGTKCTVLPQFLSHYIKYSCVQNTQI